MSTTITTAEFQTIDGQAATIEYLGDGNWEATTPNGVWTITADAGEDDLDRAAFHIEGPNHHHADAWVDTIEDVVLHLHRHGTDGRTARHLDDDQDA